MKSAWRDKVVDLASWNSNATEEINIEEFIECLELDEDRDKWDREPLDYSDDGFWD